MSTLDRPAGLQLSAPTQGEPSCEPTRIAEAPPVIPEDRAQPRQPLQAETAQLVLRGELSNADRAWLRPMLKELVASDAQTIEIDLSNVTELAPGVARLLVLTGWRSRGTERRLLLLRPPLPVRHLLQWYGGGHLVVR